MKNYDAISKNLQTSIDAQKKIYDEYFAKIEQRKIDSVQYAERIAQQQKMMDSRLLKIAKSLHVLDEAQQELAFIINTHMSKQKNTSRYLEYVKSYDRKANLKLLKQKLNIDFQTEVKPKEEASKLTNQETGEEPPKQEQFSFKAFKEILRGVLKEGT